MRFLLLAAVTALGLTGCGGDTEAATPSPSPSASPEDAYVAQLESQGPTYEVKRDPDRFIDLGWQVCDALDAGRWDDHDAATALVSVERLSLAHAEALVYAARQHLCPEV